MEMKRSDRLSTVLRVAEVKEAKVAKQFGRLQEQLLYEQKKLEQLLNYETEYQESAKPAAGRPVTVRRLQQMSQFLTQLTQAVHQQQQQVDNINKHCESLRDVWVEAHQHTQTMQQLLDRYRQEEQRQEEKQEQQDADEVNTQQFIRGKQGQ